ncbi:MAG: hypothetical protein GWN00_11340, partial [Aliifodinibius sp.]|nr:hypothetical protein [candidate division Zixibacteria bacterium]NIT56794.1 hypothetical protein [Fodinibius sp.]NIW47495.1 hypothetical protein [Gammaproteobacteria bacterium]NIU14185.1 hypothetical protein [candidate division Zixibacteria bacterium]NIV08201.1 hypothetical protein [candidate division Zixibacteria bacterium]
MKAVSVFIFTIFIIILNTDRSSAQKTPLSSWKNMPQQIPSKTELTKERETKYQLVKAFLEKEGLTGILLTQVRNVYWITAGVTNTQIVLNKDVGAASLLFMKDGSKHVICNGSEADRLMDESLRELG